MTHNFLQRNNTIILELQTPTTGTINIETFEFGKTRNREIRDGMNMEEEIKGILERYKTVAVVGISRDPGKDSYRVAEYLQSRGYNIVPINPFADEVLGRKCYKSLLDAPENIQKTIEIVDIFRPTQDVPVIVEQAIQLRERYCVPHVIWMQLGIVNEEAAELAKVAGLRVVMNRCMRIERKRLEK